MKGKKIFQLLIVSAFMVTAFMSCKKESFDINDNPNDVTDSTVVYNVVLPAALNNTGRVVARNWGWLQNYLGYWARSGTYAPNTQEETYELNTNFQTQIWTSIYDNLYDYSIMQSTANTAGADFYEGIARIMKAHNFALLVDIYNNVPYSQALVGNNNTTPAYDKGLDIYRDLLRQIDTGMALIHDADVADVLHTNLTTDDIMFAGDPTLWAQFGNTMKLRILTKFMNGGVEANSAGTIGTPASYAISQAELQVEFDSIAAEGSGFIVDDASVNPGYQADKGNPFFSLYSTENDGSVAFSSIYYRANSYAIGYYSARTDDRIEAFYAPVGSAFVGVQYGLLPINDNAAANLSAIGPGVLKTADADQWILTAAESYLLQAEVVHRGFLTGDAGSLLNQGIEASFTSLGLPAGSAQAYIDANAKFADVDYNAVELADTSLTAGGLYTIISQKWFALNAIAPYEVWSDYRRVDYSSTINHFVYGSGAAYLPGPPISVSPANAQTQIPVRLLYPQNEYLYNAANVGAEGSQGAYPFSHIFWDLN